MKNFKISSRILFLLGGIVAALSIVIVILWIIQSQQKKMLYLETETQLDNTINAIINLKTASLSQISYDYTYWDEFVENIENYDSIWFDNNISTILKSFHIDYSCVYNSSNVLIQETSSSDFSLRALVTTDLLSKLHQKKFMNFFVAAKNEVAEVSCATVHGDEDPTHALTEPVGYFFIAKIWDEEYLNELKILSNSEIKLEFDESSNTANPFVINTTYPLANWNGTTEARIVFTKELNSLKQFHQYSGYIVILVVGSFFIVLLAFYTTTKRLVGKPLELITEILKSENPQTIPKLIKSKGEFRLIGKLLSDFIEQKKQLIITREKAEESDRLKSAFLANMSHEIRTPMNGILGFAELLKEPELTGEQQAKYISIIGKSGLRMLNTINNIVDFSKIEAGMTEVFITNTNLNGQIKYIFDFFRPETEAKGLKFSYKNALPDHEAFVQTDQEKLLAILTNLVKNAIKYTDKGSIEFGYVSTGSTTQIDYTVVERGWLSEVETSRNDELIFYVKDTGIGIPSNRQKAIFERFIQADIGDKRAYQGSGLGLTIAKAYVEMLGGKIWVESQEENLEAGLSGGSVFYFTIPLAPFQNQGVVVENKIVEKRNTVEPAYHRPKLKILIAEDDQTSDEVLSIIFRDLNREMMHVTTGTEAVEACRQHPDIDLVLMDIKMPGLNGCEATRMIRNFNPKVIIIAQTAYALAGDREKALEAGCNEYLTKPLKKSDLTEIIHKFFDKKN